MAAAKKPTKAAAPAAAPTPSAPAEEAITKAPEAKAEAPAEAPAPAPAPEPEAKAEAPAEAPAPAPAPEASAATDQEEAEAETIKPAEGEVFVTVGKDRERFFRCGMRFTREPTVLVIAELAEGVLERLEAEPALIVVHN